MAKTQIFRLGKTAEERERSGELTFSMLVFMASWNFMCIYSKNLGYQYTEYMLWYGLFCLLATRIHSKGRLGLIDFLKMTSTGIVIAGVLTMYWYTWLRMEGMDFDVQNTWLLWFLQAILALAIMTGTLNPSL